MKMKYKMLATFAAAFTAATAFAQVQVTGGTLSEGILTLTGGEYTDNVTYAQATKIVVTGNAVLNFGASVTSSYSKEIEIQSGARLSAKEAPRNMGKPSKITVVAGGTLDISGTVVNSDNLFANTELCIAGTGTDGKGAIWRGSGAGCNTIFGNFTLTDDAKIGVDGMQCGCNNHKVINLNGHTLTWDGVSSDSGTFYLPYTQFKNNGSTDNPGHLAVTSGRLFFRYTALNGGSAANTITVAAGAKIKLRNMSIKPKWKLILGNNAYLENDSNDSVENVWAGPIETDGGTVLSTEQRTNRLTAGGGILGNHDLKGVGPGLVTVKGSNEVCSVLCTSSDGTLRFADSTNVISGPIAFNYGTVEFTNSVVQLTYETKGGFDLQGLSAATAARLVFDCGTAVSAVTKEDGAAYCRMYPGRYSGKYGTVTVNDAYVTNMSISVGYAGIGAFYQHGGEFIWPLDGTNYDAPGHDDTGYAYYYFDRGAKFNINFDTGGAAFGSDGVCVFDIRDGAKVSCVGTTKNFAAGCGSGTNFFYLANGGQFESEGNFALSMSSYYDMAHTMNFAFTGTGTVFKLADRLFARSSNTCSQVNISVNDGAAMEVLSIYRSADAYQKGAAMYVNSNGGIFRPRRGKADIFSGSNASGVTNMPTAVTVFERGITLDTSNQKDAKYESLENGVTYVSLVAPPENGKRIASIALPTDADFENETYLGSPIVTINSTGNGKAATAYALWNELTKKVTNIVVTCAGWGYDAETTSITIDSCDRSNSYACAFTLADQPTTGAGLRKTGAARIDISGDCSYKGDTEVVAGVLGFENASLPLGGFPSGSGIILHDGATFTMWNFQADVNVPFIRGCGILSYGHYTINNALEVNADEFLNNKYLTVRRRLIMADGAKVKILNTDALDAFTAYGSFLIADASVSAVDSPLVLNGTPTIEFADGDSTSDKRKQWRIIQKGARLYLHRSAGFTISIR